MLYSGFILGLLGSLHCIGMCGPIAFMLPVDRNNASKKVIQISLYHIGRLLSYTLIGLIFGLLGKGIYLFGFQQKLSIIIGVSMIFIALIPKHKINVYNPSKPLFGIISKLKSRLGSAFKKKTLDTFLTIGFLNGFLPCGLVYTGVFGSLILGDLGYGILYMVFFGLGTIPLMTSAIFISKFINDKLKLRIQKLIPVFVILIGVVFVLRGLGLGIPFISPEPVYDMVNSKINCH